MRFISVLIISVSFLFASTSLQGQRPVESWRDHLPYGKCIDVVMAGNLVYTATPYGLFVY
ncbi:MAG: hypothetical protein RL220_914, partial [Bacteroidota bacterium]